MGVCIAWMERFASYFYQVAPWFRFLLTRFSVSWNVLGLGGRTCWNTMFIIIARFSAQVWNKICGLWKEHFGFVSICVCPFGRLSRSMRRAETKESRPTVKNRTLQFCLKKKRTSEFSCHPVWTPAFPNFFFLSSVLCQLFRETACQHKLLKLFTGACAHGQPLSCVTMQCLLSS